MGVCHVILDETTLGGVTN